MPSSTYHLAIIFTCDKPNKGDVTITYEDIEGSLDFLCVIDPAEETVISTAIADALKHSEKLASEVYRNRSVGTAIEPELRRVTYKTMKDFFDKHLDRRVRSATWDLTAPRPNKSHDIWHSEYGTYGEML